jgi:hypothetical protein
MTSQIVSSSIDENYPIAGQDNDSQGFRDNFSIIKDGLATASSEITVLQSGTAKLNAPNNFNGTLIENALTNQLYGKVFTSTTAGTTVIDYRNGEYQIVTVAGNHSLRFLGFAGSDAEPVYAKIKLELSPSGASSAGWNVTMTAPAGGSVTGTIGFPTPGENPIINIGDNADLKTIVEVWTTNGKDFYAGLIGSFSQEFDLESLTDVILTAPTQGQVLLYNTTSGKWINGTPSVDIGSIESLENVDDVTYEDLATNDILKWNGVQWAPATDPTISSLNAIPDVAINTVLEADVLRYHVGEWQNEKDPNVVQYSLFVSDNLSINDEFFFGDPDAGGIPISNSGNTLIFQIGNIYRFNLSDSSNSRAPLRFSSTVPSSEVTAYTSNVTVVGDPGEVGAYVDLLVTKDTPAILYMYGDETGTASQPEDAGRDVAIVIKTKPYYSGSERLLSGIASNIKSVSYFETSAPSTSSLSAGVEGQVKTFVMYSASGDMVVTVANAGWKSSGTGTITLDALGKSCTLQYINEKWFCIGNNGATFA